MRFPHKLRFVFIAVQLLSASCFADINPGQPVVKKVECKTPVGKSSAMIDTVLDDLRVTYTGVGGGGITDIKQSRTNTFVVSIAQEERVDQFTYDLAIGEGCKVKILKKEAAIISFDR